MKDTAGCILCVFHHGMTVIGEAAMKNWTIGDSEYPAERRGYFETIFTLCNGYMGIRGNLEGGGQSFMRGTFIAGVYDQGEAPVEELVNCPHLSDLEIRIDDEPVCIDDCTILSHYRTLNMQSGYVTRDTVFADKGGRRLRLETKRLLSLCDPHLFVMEIRVTPMNFTSAITIASGIDGSVRNTEKGTGKKNVHFTVASALAEGDGGILRAVTLDKGIEIASGAVLTPRNIGGYARQVLLADDRVLGEIRYHAAEGVTAIIDKIVSTYTSREVDDAAQTVRLHLEGNRRIPFDTHFETHAAVMRRQWETGDILIEGDDTIQTAVRYNIFNLICLGSNLDGDTSIGARGLHGESYQGHVFWDTEIYMLPFYIYQYPDAAKRLLMYRYHRLHAARKTAAGNGGRGAQFPWESGSAGSELTPKIFVMPDGTPIRFWIGDEEIHVSADVAYGCCAYFAVTGDRDFMVQYGAEIVFEVARFWCERAAYDPDRKRYEIRSVIGPDEYHLHTDNNFYTNFMAKWVLQKASEIYRDLMEQNGDALGLLCDKIGLEGEETAQWGHVSRHMHIADTDGLIEQFDGYFDLPDHILDQYSCDGKPILPEYRDYGEYQLIKQADVVLLMTLFPDAFTKETKKVNYEYYEKRTTHLSSLSPGTYSLAGIDAGKYDMACKYFGLSARVDMDDNQGNAREGIHAASLGGTWQALVMGFGGLRAHGDRISLSPWLPPAWKRLMYTVLWRGNRIGVDITKERIELNVNGYRRGEIAAGTVFRLQDGALAREES